MSDALEFAPCSDCGTERLASTLTHSGVCPFCVDKPAPPPPEIPVVPLKKSKITASSAESAQKPQEFIEDDLKSPVVEPYVPPQYVVETSPEREMAKRILCRRRLLPFIKRFRPKYQAGWVHEDICRRLERFVKDVEDGKEPRLLLMMPPRGGKQLADDTRVPTPSGWKTHGELVAGDFVFHPSGKPVEVLATSEKTPSDVRVTFSDGSVVFCHEDHEWTLYNRMRREWQTIETGHFLRDTRFGIRKQVTSGGRSSYQLPVVSPLEYAGVDYALHPYVLGAWLGDGSAGKPCITGAKGDVAIIEKVVSLGYRVSTVCEHATTGVLTTYFSGTPKAEWPGRMTRELQGLGIYTSKRIPPEYLRLTVALRLELLAGLVDTDGTTDKNSRVTITTVSRALADDILELCTGLGFRPYIREVAPKLSTSGIQGTRPCFTVGFQPTTHLPVALDRKRVTRLAQQRRVGLVSVERASAGKQGNCIQVDSPDGLYVVGDTLLTTHNSEIGSRNFPPWVLGQHPDWEIIAASHTGSLTMSFSRYIRDLLRDPAYQVVFPEARLDPSSQSVENWNLTEGGGYLAAGVGTGITGRGAHILLLDDLVKDIEAADSPTIKENTWEWYISTAYSRLAPGGGVLGIMTWWSEDDWAGRIQQVMKMDDGGDQFEIVKYPALNEEGDEYILADDTIVEIPPLSPVPEGARMTRPRDTALHPARYTTEALKRIKRNYIAGGLKRMWQSLYQQNPTPDDGIYFNRQMIRYYGHVPPRSNARIYQAWDFAITEAEQNDYTVCATILQDERDDLYVLDVLRFKSNDGNAIVEHIIDNSIEWGCSIIGVEDGQIWKTMAAQCAKRCQERKHYPTFEVLVPLTDKMMRANPLKGRMQLGKVNFPKGKTWVEPCVRELMTFPAGKHDDQVDALAWAVRLTLLHAAPKAPAEKKPLKSWKDKIKGLSGGRGSAMAA